MSKISDPEMELLAAKWKAHLHPFPSLSKLVPGEIENDELEEISDLHDDLVMWDGYNAGLVSRVIQGQNLKLSGFSLNPEPSLGIKIDQLLSRYPKHSALFLAYKEEYNEMLEMVELASKINERG